LDAGGSLFAMLFLWRIPHFSPSRGCIGCSQTGLKMLPGGARTELSVYRHGLRPLLFRQPVADAVNWPERLQVVPRVGGAYLWLRSGLHCVQAEHGTRAPGDSLIAARADDPDLEHWRGMNL
jgi:hypothetical protein